TQRPDPCLPPRLGRPRGARRRIAPRLPRRRPDLSRHLAAAPRLAAARRPDQPHAPARDETLVLLLEAGRDAAHLDGGPFRRRASRGDGERLLPAVAIEIEEAADDLLRLGEGTVD